jgi:hypothetical protein
MIAARAKKGHKAHISNTAHKNFTFLFWEHRAKDPDPFVSVSDPDPTLMSTTNITGIENVTMYACCLALGGPTDEENQVKKIRYVC